MNTNAYKAAIHKVHERTIYEPSNALPFYVRDCGGGWACFESRHKDWRFYYLSVNTRYTEPEVVMEWSLNPMVSSDKKWDAEHLVNKKYRNISLIIDRQLTVAYYTIPLREFIMNGLLDSFKATWVAIEIIYWNQLSNICWLRRCR